MESISSYAVIGSIFDKVEAADMMGILTPKPDAGPVIEPKPASLGLLLRNLQPLAAPDALNPVFATSMPPPFKRAVTFLVFGGGLARLASLVAVGTPGTPMLAGFAMELMVTPGLRRHCWNKCLPTKGAKMEIA